MSDSPSPEQIELAKNRVETNVQKLFNALVEKPVNSDTGGVLQGTRRLEKGENGQPRVIQEVISITYDMATGEIKRVPREKVNVGDYHVLKTYLISQNHDLIQDKNKHWVRDLSKNPKYRILLSTPRGWLNPQTLNQAFKKSLEEFGGVGQVGEHYDTAADTLIKPEIVDPGESLSLVGEVVPIENFSRGDKLVYDSIQEFNKRYGPPLEDELFRQVKK